MRLTKQRLGETREVVAYPETAVLTIEDVAAWLQVSKRHAERLHIPCFYLGTRTRRYLGSTVLDYLKKKEAA
jgi:hypothetical protein